MAFLIIRIQRAESTDSPSLEILRKRHPAQDPALSAIRELLEKNGYELGDIFAHSPITEWPLTAVIYCSSNKEGIGRHGSKVYCYPIRKPTPASQETKMPKMNEGLTYWTADQVAECLDVSSDTRRKLWDILSEAKNPTPFGGDGSDGTVEEPAGRLDEENDDKAPHWWSKLTPQEQEEINKAYVQEYGE